MAVLKGVRPAGPRRERHGRECGIQGLGDAISLKEEKQELCRNFPGNSSQLQDHGPWKGRS